MSSSFSTRLFWLSALLFVGACGTATKDAVIELTSPEDGETLVATDDTDEATDGLQLDVTASSSGVSAGSRVLLNIEGEDNAITATVADDGAIEFEAATLPPGTHKIYVSTVTGSVRSDESRTYSFKALSIVSPTADQSLAFDDDTDMKSDGLQTNVSVQTYAIDPSEKISLLLDGKKLADTASPAASGLAVFKNVTLANGRHSLQAVVDDVKSEEIAIAVAEQCASITFSKPVAPADGPLVLGGKDQCPSKGAFTTSFMISTDAGEDSIVDLKVNGMMVKQTRVKGATALFEDVELGNRGDTPNTVSVIVQGANNATCAEVPFPTDILVDCAGPSCSLSGPETMAGMDGDGDPALYLNADSLDGKQGYDFDVKASKDAGKVELLVDGTTQSKTPTLSGKNANAAFKAVKLGEGEHALQARCTDASGNATLSTSSKLTVDVTACTVAISAPTDGYLFVPADDQSTDVGVQVQLAAAVGGKDCAAQRVALCDPDDGITGVAFKDDFEANGAAIEANLTLTAAAAQTLCVEVRDLAGNISTDHVDVAYFDAAPQVQIESPIDDASFNAEGNGGRIEDSLPTSTVCNATFAVACTELGATVHLHHDSVDTASFASAPCDAPQVGDDPLPTGFSGRATFTDLEFLPTGEDSTSIIASQSIMGDSGASLVGVSDAIDLTGDCAPPVVELSPDPCGGGQLNYPGSNLSANVSANLNGDDIESVAVATSNGVTSDSDSQTSPTSPVTFTGLDFGGLGTVTVTVTAVDGYDNSGSDECVASIVNDLPILMVTAPTDEQAFTAGQGCVSSVPGTFGVSVAGTADKATNRAAVAVVDGGANQALTVTGAAISGCVSIPTDGDHTIAVKLSSTMSLATVTLGLDVSVDTLSITAPAVDSVITVGNTCDTGMISELGATVTGSTDLIHNGRTVSLQAGSHRAVTTTVSAGAFSACVPVSQGNNTVSVSVLQSSNVVASETRAFKVITVAPSHSIAITSVTPPLLTSETYRKDPIAIAWTTPTEDFPGQLATYELRCANAALDVGVATPTEQSDWWAAAEVVTLPVDITPPDASADVIFRIGDKRHCVMRGADASGQETPLVNSAVVSYPFRSKVFEPTSTGQRMGDDVAPVGDVNGDGFNDVLVGGRGEAYLIFGTDAGWSLSKPNVTFTGTVADRLGGVVVGLGDFNGDETNDFAISASTATVGTAANAGRVFVFFGRDPAKGATAWPGTVDMTVACAADICFDHEVAVSGFGLGLSGAGDFNADGVSDLAIGAPIYPGTTGPTPLLGRIYVLMGKKFEMGLPKPGAFWQIDLAVPSATQGLYIEGDNVTINEIGNSIAPLGKFDGTAGMDLVVGAPSSSNSAAIAPGKVFFLSGHSYNVAAETGMKKLALSELGLRDLGGTPSGLPIDSGTKGFFGNAVYSVGNVVDLGAGTAGMRDIAIRQASANELIVYPGDTDFDTADKIRLQGDQSGFNPSTGTSIGTGYRPALGSFDLARLDGDDLDELCAGESLSSTTGTAPGAAYLWYASVLKTKTNAGVLSYTEAASIGPTPTTGAASRLVDFVGDVNGDDAPDMAIGDSTATSNKGALTLLY